MNIRQMLVSVDKYNIKCPYAMTPQYITVHNTANDASANNEATYCRNNNYEISFHYAVDDIEAVQVIPLDRNAWHCGDGGQGKGNRQSIGIEICYSRSGGDRFIKAEQNAVKLVVKLLKQYGWGLDRVKTHRNWSGKYCPHRTLDMGWNRFMSMVKAEFEGKNASTIVSNDIYRVRKTWEDIKSQQGAYKDLNNAIAQAKKVGLNVYNSKGEQVYPSNQPAPKPTPRPQPSCFEQAKEYNKARCKELQNKLIKCGYNCGRSGADGIYGEATHNALAKFQKDNGLVEDCLAGKATFAKLDSIITNMNKPKPTGVKWDYKYSDWVRRVQIRVRATADGKAGDETYNACCRYTIGYGDKGSLCALVQEKIGVPADGIIGNQSVQAIKRFQAKYGLTQDGVIGKQSWYYLLRY